MFKLFTNGVVKADSLEIKHQSILAKSKNTARSLGQRNLPAPTGDKLASYVAPITAAYQNILSTHVKRRNVGNTQLAALESNAFSGKQTQLKDRLRDLNDQLRRFVLEQDGKEEVIEADMNPGVVHTVILCLASFEALFTRKALSIFDSNNNLTQIFILFGLTIVFIVLPHSLVHVYRSTQQSRYKILIRAGVAILVIIAFSVLGILRATYLQNLARTTVEQVETGTLLTLKPMYFTIVQILLLFISSYVASLLPTGAEKSRTAKATELANKIAVVERDIRMTESELNAIPDTVYRTEASRSEGDSQALVL